MSYYLMERGWLDHPCLAGPEPFCKRAAWAWMIERAAWKPTRQNIGGKIVDIPRGQFAVSLRQMAQVWGWEYTRVLRFLRLLASDGMIATDSATGKNVVTICNYEKYQAARSDGATAAQQQRNSSATQTATASATGESAVSVCNHEEYQAPRNSSATAGATAAQQRRRRIATQKKEETLKELRKNPLESYDSKVAPSEVEDSLPVPKPDLIVVAGTDMPPPRPADPREELDFLGGKLGMDAGKVANLLSIVGDIGKTREVMASASWSETNLIDDILCGEATPWHPEYRHRDWFKGVDTPPPRDPSDFVDSDWYRPKTLAEHRTELYRRGREVLGPKAGGQIRKLLTLADEDVHDAMDVLEQTARAAEPNAYLGAILSGKRSPYWMGHRNRGIL